jgi:uncharacterized protein YegL
MAYDVLATSNNPALVIYLLDISASMNKRLGDKRRIDAVMDALSAAFQQMIFRSTKGRRLSPRYRIAIYAYNNAVYDVLGGVKTIVDIAKLGVPELTPAGTTDTAKGYRQVAKLLKTELPKLGGSPAPLVCHMTDGEYTGKDPASVVRDIMALKATDGNVLVENIFISDNIIPGPIKDPYRWPGINRKTSLKNSYAKKLRELSSSIPDSYHQVMGEMGYRLDEGAVMLFPGINPEMVAMGFQMSAATGVGQRR